MIWLYYDNFKSRYYNLLETNEYFLIGGQAVLITDVGESNFFFETNNYNNRNEKNIWFRGGLKNLFHKDITSDNITILGMDLLCRYKIYRNRLSCLHLQKNWFPATAGGDQKRSKRYI